MQKEALGTKRIENSFISEIPISTRDSAPTWLKMTQLLNCDHPGSLPNSTSGSCCLLLLGGL